MEPVCEFCGARHHPRQAHRWSEGVSVSRNPPVTDVATVATTAKTSGGRVSEAERVQAWREKNRARYNERMKAYRARRRERARAGFAVEPS